MVAFKKDILRVIKSNSIRFITLVLIITIGICFVTGVGGISDKVKNSINDYYKESNIADIIIKSKNISGINSNDINQLSNYYNIDSYSTLTLVDIENTKTRYYIYDFNSSTNKISLLDGRLPNSNNEIVVERSNSNSISYNIGDSVSIYNNDYTIVGIVSNPLILSKTGELAQISNDYLDTIVYFSSDFNPFNGYMPTTDIYIHLNNNYSYFSKNYEVNRDNLVNELKEYYNEDNYSILTLNQNLSFAFLDNITDKVDVIAMLFPIFFILVVALVTLTNMSRLIDEERKSIGCLKSLGYSNSKIIFKYLSFAFIATLIGCLLGLVSGVFIIPNIVYQAFAGMFNMPKMTKSISFSIGLITSIGMILITLLVTFIVSHKTTSEIPSRLFVQNKLKPGKKILLERISFIWNKISFRYKSTIRNMFRFKSRFIMIVVSISLSTLLVMAGLGLYDVAKGDLVVEGFRIDSTDTIKVISIAIIIFALLLSILVLYNLTTMNIGEREREIATLKVLGYQVNEVNGFIYREIFIMSLIGIIIGIPLGVLFLLLVFNMMNFGSISNIKWTSYILALVISILFIFIVFLLTKKKIKRVDMNDSLKSID